MAVDYLIGQTQAQLEDALRSAQQELLDGQTLTSTGDTSASVSGPVQAGITRRIRLILSKLHTIDPTTYPATSIRPDTVVKLDFS